MTVAWYDRDLKTVPSAEIETPFGLMTIKPSSPETGYTAYCELKEPVLINRVRYILQGTYHLDRQTEEWYGGLYPRRVVDEAPGRYNPKGWKIARECAPTDKAREAAKKINPLFKQWAEDNFKLLLNGRHVEMENLIQRARHKLDAAIEAINERRAELARMQRELESSGGLQQRDMELLNDLWGHHWKF